MLTVVMVVRYARCEVDRQDTRGKKVVSTWVQTRIRISATKPYGNEAFEKWKMVVKATGFSEYHKSKNRGQFWHIPATALALVECATAIRKAYPGAKQYLDEFCDGVRKSPTSVGDVEIRDLPRAIMKPWDHQRVGSHLIGQLEGVMLAYDMGCVDADTEFLTPHGWKRIVDYTDGDLVAQYDRDDGSVQFVEPERHVAIPCERMYRFHHGYLLDMALCGEHVLALYDRDSEAFYTQTVGDVLDEFDASEKTIAKYPVTRFTYDFSNRPGVGLDERELRLQVAVMADGHFPKRCETKRCYIRLKKERKIERMREFLGGFPYDERPCEPDGFVKFAFDAPLKEKRFPSSWWDRVSLHDAETIFDEVFHWDGNADTRSYWSRHESDADFVQFVAQALGQVASKKFGSDGVWKVYIRRKNRYCFTQSHLSTFKPKDGLKYCFTVPSGFFVARRNGFVFVTGNCGKTKTVYDAIVEYGLKRTFVVCPANVIDVWTREAKKHVPPGEPVVVMPLGKKHSCAERRDLIKAALAESDHTGIGVVAVINYEAIASPHGKCIRDFVAEEDWDLVVADECHRAANTSTNTGKFFCRMVHRSKHRVGLSGTPLGNGPQDAFGQFRFVDPGLFGEFVTRFRSRYLIMGGFEGKQVLDYQNEMEFRERMARLTVVVKLRDVVELPSERDEERLISLDPPTLKVYRELRDEFIADWKDGVIVGDNVLTRLTRLAQITSGFSKVKDEETEKDRLVEIGTEKTRAVMEILDDLPPDEPVVVFCRFVHDLHEVKRGCLLLGSPAGSRTRQSYLMGGGRSELREWEESCDRGEGPVIAVQLKAGGVGIDLTKACYGIYFSIGFEPIDYRQSRARIMRPGQTRPVIYYHLIAPGTVDRLIYRAQGKKRAVVDSVIDDLVNARDLV